MFLVLFLSVAPLAAGVLSSFGQLQLPAPCPGSACGPAGVGVGLAITNNISSGFTGTWSTTAAAPWQGTFNATVTGVSSGGSYPGSAVGASTSTWDFTTLNSGFLPAGTIVAFGDLDSGSGGGEEFDLIAYDQSSAEILTPWLDDVFLVTSGNPSDFTQGSMPEYSWNAETGKYIFDGGSVAGNPNLGTWITTNSNVYSLSVQKFTTNYSIGFSAPAAAPEPDSLIMLGLGLAGLVFACLRAPRPRSL